MNVLIIGSGGREHALAWKISQSPLLSDLFILPGNPGTSQCGTNLPGNSEDFQAMMHLIRDLKINLLVVGPEAPLVAGIHDHLRSNKELKDLLIIGPDRKGAMLEGSKDFAKEFMFRHNIPTARYRSFTGDSLDAGKKFLEELEPPFVLKADGLAAGKGVIITEHIEHARNELENMLKGKFGKASSKVIVEEYLPGIELSAFILTDGNGYIILPEAKDYKRAGEGDKGLNTGGMGAVSPVPFADRGFMEKVEKRIIIPTVEGLKSEGIHYCGFIFAGLMNVGGEPYVIEYNVRMGDPEAEVVIPRIKSDLLEMLLIAGTGNLSGNKLITDSRYCTTVMLTSGGYPEDYQKGMVVTGTEIADESIIFHAGTKDDHGTIVTAGGRVLAVTSFGGDLRQALNKTYRRIEGIHFDKMFFRRDIGFDLFI